MEDTIIYVHGKIELEPKINASRKKRNQNMNCGPEQFHPQYVGANKFPFFLFQFAQIFIQA